jgi:hypothetical protein
MSLSDGPDFRLLSIKEPVARTPKTCHQCGKQISVGQKYRRITGTEDGAFMSWVQHVYDTDCDPGMAGEGDSGPYADIDKFTDYDTLRDEFYRAELEQDATKKRVRLGIFLGACLYAVGAFIYYVVHS